MKRPELLLVNAETNLLPKLEFLRSIGVSLFDIARIVSYDPTLFMYSLTKSIIPNYNAFKSIVGSDESVVKAFNRHSGILRERTSTNVVRNLNLLRELGTPESSITRMLTKYPRTAFVTHKRFKAIVDYLKALGCNPSKASFDQAIRTIYGIGKATVEHKFNIYARWGWSKEDSILAFECQPSCMSLSEKRIMSGMDFLVNKMGFSSKLIARSPVLLCLSLERRIIPRCLVAQVLLHNGLIKKDFKLTTFLECSENDFLQKFVINFQEQVPQLRDVYDRKVDIMDLGINFKVDTIDRSIDFKDPS